ncbi:MAG: tRNA (N(6)-L-threonylcarbamoyladenosine(37)-C(2))-methylthiotransferase MtaB [Prevotella sp.]|nr:tRNA (N(6)-L-threonylcarbamoyladenosine(37)-C(2))-methylthiotransferase MtaB [Prevotella sp.]
MPDTSVLNGKKAKYYTLGCKLNYAETAAFARQLRALGVAPAGQRETADICLVNTCAVTETAAAKCRQTIHRVIRRNPGAFVVVTGCFAQLFPSAVAAIEGVSLVLGNNEKARLTEYLTEAYMARMAGQTSVRTALYTTKTKDITSFAPSCSRGNRTRYFLKVQDGCNYFCTYCAIPFARGRSRNPSIASLVEQAEQAASEGAREIVLTGVNIGDFGRTGGERFLDLLCALERVEGIDRYRISSLEPDLLDEEIIEFCARESRKFMPHFHIPLQSGTDEVLRLMHRRYDTELFARKVSYIKSLLPDAFIGVDVMTGCRGETEKLFDDCYEFIRSLPVSKLHVFPYSERPDTAALRIPYVVSEREKHRRTNLLIALSDGKQHEFYASFMGAVRPVLFERAGRDGIFHGFTDNYIRAELPSYPSKVRANESTSSLDAECSRSSTIVKDNLDNRIINVRLTRFNGDGSALECVPVD